MADDPVLPKLPVPGAIVGGKYAIVGTIGKGGMGMVFEATHVRLRQRVAIKMLYPHVRDAPGAIERFEREARAAGQLRSPNVTRVLDVETADGELPYIVMEFLDGNDLSDELAGKGRLPVATTVDYILQASAAIREAHSMGIIHRDLKPANLFLTATPEGPQIKVLDFGISKITSEADGRLTAAMTTMGSPVYMSPEQLRALQEVDTRADIWGLGVTLFELLVGRPPHAGTVTATIASILSDETPKPSSLRKDLPAALDPVVLKALAKNPADRYQDADAFADALLPYASPEGAARWRSSRTTPQGPASKRVPPAMTAGERNAPTEMSVRQASQHDLTGKETGQSWSTASFARAGRPRLRAIALAALAGAILATLVLALSSPRPTAPERAAASLPAAAPPPPPVSPPPAPVAPTASAADPETPHAAPTAAAAVPSIRPAAPNRAAPRRPAIPEEPTANPLHL